MVIHFITTCTLFLILHQARAKPIDASINASVNTTSESDARPIISASEIPQKDFKRTDESSAANEGSNEIKVNNKPLSSAVKLSDNCASVFESCLPETTTHNFGYKSIETPPTREVDLVFPVGDVVFPHIKICDKVTVLPILFVSKYVDLVFPLEGQPPPSYSCFQIKKNGEGPGQNIKIYKAIKPSKFNSVESETRSFQELLDSVTDYNKIQPISSGYDSIPVTCCPSLKRGVNKTSKAKMKLDDRACRIAVKTNKSSYLSTDILQPVCFQKRDLNHNGSTYKPKKKNKSKGGSEKGRKNKNRKNKKTKRPSGMVHETSDTPASTRFSTSEFQTEPAPLEAESDNSTLTKSSLISEGARVEFEKQYFKNKESFNTSTSPTVLKQKQNTPSQRFEASASRIDSTAYRTNTSNSIIEPSTPCLDLLTTTGVGLTASTDLSATILDFSKYGFNLVSPKIVSSNAFDSLSKKIESIKSGMRSFTSRTELSTPPKLEQSSQDIDFFQYEMDTAASKMETSFEKESTTDSKDSSIFGIDSTTAESENKAFGIDLLNKDSESQSYKYVTQEVDSSSRGESLNTTPLQLFNQDIELSTQWNEPPSQGIEKSWSMIDDDHSSPSKVNFNAYAINSNSQEVESSSKRIESSTPRFNSFSRRTRPSVQWAESATFNMDSYTPSKHLKDIQWISEKPYFEMKIDSPPMEATEIASLRDIFAHTKVLQASTEEVDAIDESSTKLAYGHELHVKKKCGKWRKLVRNFKNPKPKHRLK